MTPEEELVALESIIDQILKGVQDAIQNGETLSDEFQGILAQELTQTTDRIAQLYQQVQQNQELQEAEQEQAIVADEVSGAPPGAPPTGGHVPPLEQAPHESSNINAFRYEPDSQKLYIKFQGKYPQQNGPVYSYEGVPGYIFDVIRRGSVAPKTSGSNAWHTWKEGITPSHGASVNALLKAGGFSYQRLS